jgi:hypothetical protein
LTWAASKLEQLLVLFARPPFIFEPVDRSKYVAACQTRAKRKNVNDPSLFRILVKQEENVRQAH